MPIGISYDEFNIGPAKSESNRSEKQDIKQPKPLIETENYKLDLLIHSNQNT